MSANKNDVLNIDSINTYEKNGTIIFYYVNFNPSGFVIIGADNRIKPILGYSFKNNFSVNNTSSNLQWLFRKFHKEFEISVEALDSPSTQILEQWDYYSNSYINSFTPSIIVFRSEINFCTQIRFFRRDVFVSNLLNMHLLTLRSDILLKMNHDFSGFDNKHEKQIRH